MGERERDFVCMCVATALLRCQSVSAARAGWSRWVAACACAASAGVVGRVAPRIRPLGGRISLCHGEPPPHTEAPLGHALPTACLLGSRVRASCGLRECPARTTGRSQGGNNSLLVLGCANGLATVTSEVARVHDYIPGSLLMLN
eukprot:5329558-Prymnesium_polylepis.1